MIMPVLNSNLGMWNFFAFRGCIRAIAIVCADGMFDKYALHGVFFCEDFQFRTQILGCGISLHFVVPWRLSKFVMCRILAIWLGNGHSYAELIIFDFDMDYMKFCCARL